MLYSDFKTLLCPREGELISRNTIRIGDRKFGPLVMTLIPQTQKPFQDLSREFSRRDERLPYCISFPLEDGGLNMGFRPLPAAILAFSSSDNKKFNKVVDALKELNLEDVCCIRFRLCFRTWACVMDSEQEKLLHRGRR